MYIVCTKPNKKMHTTKPARSSFRIIARPKRLGGYISFLLPVRARVGHVILGVSALCRAKRVAQSGVENNSLDDSATHNPDKRAGCWKDTSRKQ